MQNIAQPIGVSTYRVTRKLPASIREEVPTVEDLEEVVTKLRNSSAPVHDLTHITVAFKTGKIIENTHGPVHDLRAARHLFLARVCALRVLVGKLAC